MIYLCTCQVEVVAATEEDFRAWDGWVHSRLRQLVMRVEPYVTVRPWPKAVAPPREDEPAGQPRRCFYFMGLKKKQLPAQPGGKASTVNLSGPVQEFKMQARPPRQPINAVEWKCAVQRGLDGTLNMIAAANCYSMGIRRNVRYSLLDPLSCA
jgi:hypothetical protein